jgi:hypothetical protein
MTLAPADILCPCCGYDLRAIDSERCPECGWDIDRTGLAASQIPWTFRGHGTLGRWRAYWRTMWLATWRIKRLSAELHRPIAARDAKRFATVTALIASVPFALLVIGLVINEGGTGFLTPVNLEPPPATASRFSPSSPPSMLPPAADALVPYAAGMTAWPVLPIAIVMFAWLCTRIPPRVFRRRGGDVSDDSGGDDARGDDAGGDDTGERARTLAYYLAAPLATLPLVLFFYAVILAHFYLRPRTGGDIAFDIVTSLLAIAVGVFAFVLWWFNTLRLLRRTTTAARPRPRAAHLIGPAVGIVSGWCACAMIAFLVFPWVMGYLWLMIESVRS